MEILLADLPLHIQAIGGLILALALLFLGFFVAPALGFTGFSADC